MLLIESILVAALAAQAPDGALTVVAEPDALVVWEGVQLGRTDSRGRLNISGIPPGGYDVAVSKEGFETLTRRIEVLSGRREVAFRLAPLQTAISSDAPRPPPPPSPTPAPPAAEPAAEPRVEAKAAGVVGVELSGSGPRERKASQVVEESRSDSGWLWLLPLVAFVAVVLAWMARSGSAPADPAREFPKPFGAMPDFGEEPAPEPHLSSVTFLDDLRRREAMADRGVELPPEDSLENAIDLDENDVRSLDGSAANMDELSASGDLHPDDGGRDDTPEGKS